MPLTITIGEPKFGNGFYLNVPDAKSYVILTAAHNLIDDNGNPSKELHVVRREGDKGDRIPPTNLTTFVCPDYKPSATKGRPKGTTADSDYGVLLTPKPSEASKDGGRSYIGIGFGFALKLSHEDLCGANLDLCGYVSQEEKANAQDSLDARSGLCLDASDGSLEYDMHTMPGLSGSPIFKGYKGHETVVAIHNNGPASPGKGSKGARLSCKTLEQIFNWAGLAYKGKAVRATDSPDTDPLYLHFLPNEDYAWVHLSKQGLDTSFDVFPAYAPTSPLNANICTLYAFRYVQPLPTAKSNRHWVLWDVVRREVTLTESLQDYCFPRLVPTKDDYEGNPGWRIVLPNGARRSSLMELRMDPRSITPLDRQMGELDGCGVSFSTNYDTKKVSKDNYNVFRFEEITRPIDRCSG